MRWTLVPLLELPFREYVPYPDDWADIAERRRWEQARADALAIPVDDLIGRDHVAVRRLSAEAWRRVLAEIECGDDEPLRFDGGLGLFVDGSEKLLPGCCSSIDESAGEWRKFVEGPPNEWSMLWIGHPWVLVKGDGSDALISEPTELIDNLDGHVDVIARVPREQLRVAFDHAMSQAALAADRLRDALEGRALVNDARRSLGLA